VSPKKDRGPKSLITPTKEKQPRALSDEDWLEMRPAWRVSLLEMFTPFGWSAVNRDSAAQIRERLASYETMKWKEIMYTYRSHLIRRTDLCREAQNHLEQIQQDDVDAVMSLGITQQARVYGILDHNVLKILWWDHDHLVCPVEKPNT